MGRLPVPGGRDIVPLIPADGIEGGAALPAMPPPKSSSTPDSGVAEHATHSHRPLQAAIKPRIWATLCQGKHAGEHSAMLVPTASAARLQSQSAGSRLHVIDVRVPLVEIQPREVARSGVSSLFV